MQTELSNVEVTIETRANCLARVSEAAHALAAAHVQEQFRDGTSRSCLGAASPVDRVRLIPGRDRWLGPILSPARTWQFRSKSTVAAVVGLIGLMAAAAAADIIPIRQFPSFDFWRQIAFDRKELVSWSALRVPVEQSVHAKPRLIVQPSPEASGKPTRLGLALQGHPEGAVVTITGLVPGMKLSNGEPFGATAWRLAARDLGDIWIGPPDNFVGSIDLIVELWSSDDRIVDRQAVHLEWLP